MVVWCLESQTSLHAYTNKQQLHVLCGAAGGSSARVHAHAVQHTGRRASKSDVTTLDPTVRCSLTLLLCSFLACPAEVQHLQRQPDHPSLHRGRDVARE